MLSWNESAVATANQHIRQERLFLFISRRHLIQFTEESAETNKCLYQRGYGQLQDLRTATCYSSLRHYTDIITSDLDFDTQSGVLQGDTLGPFLFIPVLNSNALQGHYSALVSLWNPSSAEDKDQLQVSADTDFEDEIILLASNSKV